MTKENKQGILVESAPSLTAEQQFYLAFKNAKQEINASSVEKRGEVDIKAGFGKSYQYRRYDDIVALVAPILAKNDLFITFNQAESVVQVINATSAPNVYKGEQSIPGRDTSSDVTNVFKMVATVQHIAGYSQTYSLYQPASKVKEGASLMQHMGQLITYAMKYLFTMIFQIATMDDDDATPSDDKTRQVRVAKELISPAQVMELAKLCKDSNTAPSLIISSYNSAMRLNMSVLADLPLEYFEAIKSRLLAKMPKKKGDSTVETTETTKTPDLIYEEVYE